MNYLNSFLLLLELTLIDAKLLFLLRFNNYKKKLSENPLFVGLAQF